MKKIATFIVVVAVLALAETAEAQNRGGGGGHRFDAAEMLDNMFEKDTNSDGRLSAEELGARGAQMLERAGGNSDGFLTRDEVNKMMEGFKISGAQGGADGDGQRQGGGQIGAGGQGGAGSIEGVLAILPVMKALDKDGNGELSRAEIEGAVQALESLDKDNDGRISAEEMMPDMSQFGVRDGGRGPGGRARGGDGRRARGSDGGVGRTQRPKIDE